MPYTRQEIALRASKEIHPGSVVNLGIGLPTLVAGYVSDKDDIWFHSENGLLGMGPFPYEGEEDPQLINAGKQTVTCVNGASTFDSSLSFAMIRGGHIDVAILGAMQISAGGDLANWSIPGGRTMGIGGAMDLSSGAKRVIALMSHVSKKGHAKLKQECGFPLTAVGVISRVITDLGVFDPIGDVYKVVELAPGVELKEVQDKTEAEVVI